MPHRKEALQNFLAMLGPRARMVDPEALTAGLAGMGIVIDAGSAEAFAASQEKAIGMYAKATDADLRDYQVRLRAGAYSTNDYPLFEIEEQLQLLGFTIARL